MRALEEAEKLDDEMRHRVEQTRDLSLLEDLIRPIREARRHADKATDPMTPVAEAILAADGAGVDGYVVVQLNCWNRVVQPIAASGKPTLYADFQYGGSGGFLVYTSTQASLVRRRNEMGLLRSLGTTSRQLFLLVLGEVALLGLLGTVTGMIEVFEVMAISGSGNPRSMASGVSKATVPTMAGMVAALSGVAMSAYLENKARREREFIADELIIEHG